MILSMRKNIMSSITAIRVFKAQIQTLESKMWLELKDKYKAQILNNLMINKKIPYRFDEKNIRSAEGTVKYLGVVPGDFCFTSYYINQLRAHNFHLIKEIRILKNNIVYLVSKHGLLQN